MTSVLRRQLPLHPLLGRHVEHDPKSWNYRIAPAKGALKTTWWTGSAPGLDQGNTGSCTGNADAQLMNLDVWSFARAKILGHTGYFDEKYARNTLYHLATVLDGYPGVFPPEDTGSSGLAVAKADVKLGLAGSYRHSFSFTSLLTGLQKAPCIVGTDWYNGMFNTDKNFYAKPSGKLAGGHEYLCFAVDMEKQELWFRQSWGLGYGTEVPNVCPSQAFRMTFPVFQKLLAAQGDATFPVPVAA